MKKTTMVWVLIAGLSTAAFAFQGNCSGDKHRGGMFKTVQELDLSSTQKDALKELRKSRKEEMTARREAMKSERKKSKMAMNLDFSTFMTGDTFDKEAFKKQLKVKHEEKRAKREGKKEMMLEKRAEGMEKVFQILTVEQRVKWIELSKTK